MQDLATDRLRAQLGIHTIGQERSPALVLQTGHWRTSTAYSITRSGLTREEGIVESIRARTRKRLSSRRKPVLEPEPNCVQSTLR